MDANPPVLQAIRRETSELHRSLETRFDAVSEFSDKRRHDALARRYAALHLPVEKRLAPWLEDTEGLDFEHRSRATLLAGVEVEVAFCPQPRSRAEALGMLYVLEGSTLGGRMILRALAKRGVDISRLGFLDPYGERTGSLWRDFLAVLCRDAGASCEHAADACRGAVATFLHAERVLCGRAA